MKNKKIILGMFIAMLFGISFQALLSVPAIKQKSVVPMTQYEKEQRQHARELYGDNRIGKCPYLTPESFLIWAKCSLQ